MIQFPNTPSGGRVEARAGLMRAGAFGGRHRTLRDLQRQFPFRARAQVQGVLDTLVAEGDAVKTGAEYGITSQGVGNFREHPNPRYMSLDPADGLA